MVDFEELSEDMIPQGDLAYMVELVFPQDTDTLLSFFEFYGIEDFDDFMSFEEVEFDKHYNNLSNPDMLLSLSTSLINKLLSVQSWYAYMLQYDDNDPVNVVYSLTTKVLSTWRRNQVEQRLSTDSSFKTPPPSVAETTPSTTVPSPSFWHNIKINISDYPKLKDDTQWRTFNCQLHYTAASHDTLDVLDPAYVPPLEDQDSSKRNKGLCIMSSPKSYTLPRVRIVSVTNAIR
jgi:hypothetical protein